MDRSPKLIRTDKRKMAHRPEEIFPLICPVRNSEWMPGWREQCRLIHSESGVAEEGCVFRVTGQPHLGGTATLVCTTYAPPFSVAYTSVNDDLVYRIKWLFKRIEKGDESGTEIELQRSWTALNKKAEAFIAELERSAAGVPELFGWLEYYLDQGRLYRN